MNSPSLQMAKLALAALPPGELAELLANYMPAAPAPIPSEGRARTISDSAKAAGMSRMTLYRAIEAGALKTVCPYAGARPRITEAELARWLGAKGGR